MNEVRSLRLKRLTIFADGNISARLRGSPAYRPPMRNATCHSYLVLLATSVMLAGCGATSTTGAANSQAALARVKAPSGYRLVTCHNARAEPDRRCYRHGPFVAINAASLSALIAASGLKADHNPPLWCNSGRPRPSAAIAQDNCLADANLGSVEFEVSATSVKVLRRSLLRPRDLKVIRSMRGTIYEVTPVMPDGNT